MAYSLIHVHGIGPVHHTSLARHNIRNTDHLLHVTSETGPRRQLSRDLGIPESELKRWNEFVRLLRLPGIGPSYARALAESGAGSVGALAHANRVELTGRLAGTCRAEGLRAPSEETVKNWIGEARTLIEGTAPW